MAVLYITELESLGAPSEGGHLPVAHFPPVAEQTLSISGSSAQATAFAKATRFVRLETDTNCSFGINTNPTAQAVSSTQTGTGAANTARLAAGIPEYFAVTPGHILAAITTT